MTSFLNSFAKQVLTGDTVKDWSHASKIFTTNFYERAPKYGFLYYVNLSFGSTITLPQGQDFRSIGVLVKSMSLPKFNVETKSLNAYGQPYLVQTKLGYDAVNIVFHDDSKDEVRSLWKIYQDYYYANNRANITTGNTGTGISSPSVRNIFSGTFDGDRGYNVAAGASAPFFESITVFSFFNKQFSTYRLINPMIKSFGMGEHNASNGTSTLESTLSVDYEGVLYKGPVLVPKDPTDSRKVHELLTGFNDAGYDTSPSPLVPAGGGTQSIFGQGGIVDGLQAAFNSGDIGSAAFILGRTFQTNQNANLKAMVKSEGTQMLREGVKGALSTNPKSSVNIPTLGNLGSAGRNAVNSKLGKT